MVVPHNDTKVSAAGFVFLVAMMVMCAGCGDGGNTGGEPPLPGRNDPAFGTVGNVLISDRLFNIDGVSDELWIGFNRQQDWDRFVALNQEMESHWIGGHLIADPHHHLGFYFDPNTTSAAEVTAETQQTIIDALKRNPQFFAEELPGWDIPAIVEKIVPTAN